jgi:NAD(P)H-dependent FMN reductase
MSNVKLGLIYGSTREGRFCDTVANWTAEEIARHEGFSLDVIDPAAYELPSRYLNTPNSNLSALADRFGRADAFIIVTPEYNHSYPASLKLIIDAGTRQWHAKPVALVSYGGVAQGLRAVEHLRGVFSELHAVTLRDGVSFNIWEHFDPEGRLVQPERARKSMDIMLSRLNWWATALKTARDISPFDLN